MNFSAHSIFKKSTIMGSEICTFKMLEDLALNQIENDYKTNVRQAATSFPPKELNFPE